VRNLIGIAVFDALGALSRYGLGLIAGRAPV